MGGAAIALVAVCAGVSPANSTDVFEDAFAPVPWQAGPRVTRTVDSSQWRGKSQQSEPQEQSRPSQSGLTSASKRRTAATHQSASTKLQKARRVKPVAYNNIVQSGDDEGYVLDPATEQQGPIAAPMEIYEGGMDGDPMYDDCGDPSMCHPWQGGEYWFNPRYGLPPFICRFPHWMHLVRGRLWFRGEYLSWWMSGNEAPPLVTSSTDLADAGVLYRPTTSILSGGEKMNSNSQSGYRYQLGCWVDAAQCFGWEANYFDVGDSKDVFSTDTHATPIIARPYTDADTGGQAAALLSYPDVLEGSVQVESVSEFRSFEFLFRRAVMQRCDRRIDVVFGYRYGRLEDRLQITDYTHELTDNERIFSGYDRFKTRNQFNGAEIGIIWNKRTGRWGMELLAKLALGRTSSRVEIDGATTITGDGTYQGDILALPSNIGVYKTKEVAVMPEIGANLMWWLTPRASFTFGYTFVYLSHVARPSDQIDMMVNSSQFPPGTISGVGLPDFQFRTTDFWAHGINVGFDYRF